MYLLLEKRKMKIGTEQVKRKILQKLKRYNAVLKGIKYGDFADELTDEIMELIGADMRNKQWDLAHDFPADLAGIVDAIERELGLRNMKRDERAQEVYRWIIEQEAAGKTIKKFAKWALMPERVQYVGKYKTPESIKNDWTLAFGVVETFQRNEDGSLYV